jgi:hypothetical protein
MAEPLSDSELEERLCRALHAGTEELLSRVALAYAGEEAWCDRLRAVAHEMLRFLQEDHERARMMTVDVLLAGERAQLVRDQGMQALIELIDQGRQELPDPASISRAVADGIGGAIYHRIYLAIAVGDFEALEPLVPELMYNAVLPYLGTEAAMAELAIPPPSSDNNVSHKLWTVPSG